MTQHQYIYGPADKKDIKRAVIFLHGYGANGQDLISLAPLWHEALPNTAYFAPNAPERCELAPPGAPSGFQWFSLMDRTPAVMTAGAEAAKSGLETYINGVAEQTGLKMADIAIVGFSQGTMMALHTLLAMEEGCAGILAYSGRLIEPKDIKSKPPVCAVHGTADEVVPFESLEGIRAFCAENDIPVEHHERQGLGHGIDEQALRIGETFLKKCFDLT